MIKALIVDDDASNRDYLRSLLAVHPEVTVIGEAGTISHAHELLSISLRYKVKPIFPNIPFCGRAFLKTGKVGLVL